MTHVEFFRIFERSIRECKLPTNGIKLTREPIDYAYKDVEDLKILTSKRYRDVDMIVVRVW